MVLIHGQVVVNRVQNVLEVAVFAWSVSKMQVYNYKCGLSITENTPVLAMLLCSCSVLLLSKKNDLSWSQPDSGTSQT